jgi:hypothetical protein
MAWPIAAVMAVSAVAQYYQAEQARGANKRELNKIKEQFNSIKPPEWDLSVDDPIDRLQSLPLPPNYDMSRITPKTIQMVSKFSPEAAARIQEQAPELAKASQAAQTGRQAQLAALERYQQISQGGEDPELAQAMTQAAQRSDREAQSRQASVLQDAARRGTLGSGQMLAGQLQASSDASQRGASAAQLAAAESYRNRLNALSQGAQIGGQVRSSEMGEAQNNADIINQFNQRNTAAYQNYLNNASQMRNQANLRNLGEEQRIQELNAGNQYQSDWANRDYQNKAKDLTYNRAVSERDAQYRAGQAARARKDELKQSMYNNERGVAQDARGLGQMGMEQRNQSTAATNQAIQGLGDTAATYYSGERAAEERQKDREAYGYGNSNTRPFRE